GGRHRPAPLLQTHGDGYAIPGGVPVSTGNRPGSSFGPGTHSFSYDPYNPYNPPPGQPVPPPPPGYAPGRRARASQYARQPLGRGGRPPGWIKRWGPWVALGLVVLVSGVLGYVLWTLRDVPDPGKAPTLSRTVTIYDRNGNVIETHNNDGQYYEKIDNLSDM